MMDIERFHIMPIGDEKYETGELQYH